MSKQNLIKDNRELKQFIQNALNDIKKGVGNDFHIDGSIEFEIAVVKIKEAGGRFKIYVVDAGGKYNKEELSKIKFKISQNSHMPASSGGSTIFGSLDKEF